MIGDGMSTVEVLKAARAKIADERHWIQGVAARDWHEVSVEATDKSAVCWCSSGALYAVTGKKSWGEKPSAISFLESRMEGHAATFNDSHTHAEVIAAWDAAIADAETAVETGVLNG